MGEVYSIRETLCRDLPPDQQVDGAYRNLENFLLLLAKFYFETDQYRKPGDKLVDRAEQRLRMCRDGRGPGSKLVSYRLQ